jgi:hypothetical protein
MPEIEMPVRYTDMLANTPMREVSYGAGGLKLFDLAELPDGQIGYSIGPDGTSLCTPDSGAWQPGWIVIGYDTGLGDPLILNIADPTLPVYTSMPGGPWELQPIAVSLEAFTGCLREFSNVAQGRSNPVEKGENPLSDFDRETYRSRIAKINEEKIDPDFWDALLEY